MLGPGHAETGCLLRASRCRFGWAEPQVTPSCVGDRLALSRRLDKATSRGPLPATLL